MNPILLSTHCVTRSGLGRPRYFGSECNALVAVPAAVRFTLVAASSGLAPGDSIKR